LFHPVLNLWVFEEIVNGEKLSNIINTKKENVKSDANLKAKLMIAGTFQGSGYPTTSTPSPTLKPSQKTPTF
jgi:hypothetical protein